eukprot:TRINITY_DN222_c0_g2_i2.p1 TRINITY_DN222_c0_g2~~TRINITY_DN222_c0_g2_i2.p1  ORF type:complete len:243 (+),score=59.80 TRINITY_DN222_c0_g2_i2:89-730(+)
MQFCDGCELKNEEGAKFTVEMEVRHHHYMRQDRQHVKCAFGVVWPEEGEPGEYDKSKEKPEQHSSMDSSKCQKANISVVDCMKEFTKKEKLSKNDPWYCNKCKKHQLATKKFDLWTLPEILIIHLKRFSYTRYHRDKITSVVSFPLENLDLSDFCRNEEMKESRYDLFAVSNHMGNLGSGHYTAYAKNIKDKNWYELNDRSTMQIDPKRIRFA